MNLLFRAVDLAHAGQHPRPREQLGLGGTPNLMARVAEQLGIKVSSAGNREEDPYATPFKVLVFEAERVLPEGAWSPNLATCAKRIETSLKPLNPPYERIRPKPDEFFRVTYSGVHQYPSGHGGKPP